MAESNSDSTFETNPYAPTASSSSIQDQLTRELVDARDTDYEPSTLGWTAFRWFSICTLCAVPSFIVGWSISEGRYDAMLTGIVIFSLAYTFLDYGTARQSWRRKRMIRRTLRTMYGTRIAITILFPIGYALDLFCGAFSIQITQAIAGSEFTSSDTVMHRFDAVLLTTVIQGCIMNLVVAAYGLVILTLLAVVSALRG